MRSVDIRAAFDALAGSVYRGVRGIAEIQGTRPGKTFLLSVLTHGNEQSGLAAVGVLLRSPRLRAHLRGRILLVISNLEAGTRCWSAATPLEKRLCRYVEANMNRLPADILERSPASLPPDFRRAVELAPIYREAEIGLDLHSAIAPVEPMLIDVKGEAGTLDELSDGVPARIRVANMGAVQTGWPLSLLFGGIDASIPVFEVEAGSHEEPTAPAVAVLATLALLRRAGMLEGEDREHPCAQSVYRVIGSVRFPDLSYALRSSIPAFHRYARGDVIAAGDGPPIVAERDCLSLFSRGAGRLINASRLQEEVLFLTDPVRERQRTLRYPVRIEGIEEEDVPGVEEAGIVL